MRKMPQSKPACRLALGSASAAPAAFALDKLLLSPWFAIHPEPWTEGVVARLGRPVLMQAAALRTCAALRRAEP